MRYQVPQFVDIEDQIIGPLTLRQFLMYVAVTLILVPVFLYSDLSLFIVIAVPAIGVAAAFAHWKINGRSLAFTLASAARFFTSGQMYIWRRTSKSTALSLRDNEWHELTSAREESQEEVSSALDTIARDLETEGNVSTTDEEDPMETNDQIPNLKSQAIPNG